MHLKKLYDSDKSVILTVVLCNFQKIILEQEYLNVTKCRHHIAIFKSGSWKFGSEFRTSDSESNLPFYAVAQIN